MPGKSSRTKGATAERELAKLLNAWLQDNEAFPGRNLEQSRSGGHDLLSKYPVAVEVKRQERSNLPKWIKQAQEQADRMPGCLPVLAHRSNNQPWQILMIMTIEEFGSYLQELGYHP